MADVPPDMREERALTLLEERAASPDPDRELPRWAAVEIRRLLDDRTRERDKALKALGRILKTVDQQAEDEGLWFWAIHTTEAYLQQELRRLHAIIEGETAVYDLRRINTETKGER